MAPSAFLHKQLDITAKRNSLLTRAEFVHTLIGVRQMEIPRGIAHRGGIGMQDVLAKVQGAFHDAFDIDPQSVSLETSADDIPDWDSVGHLALISNLERTFGISLDVDDIMEMENVRDIVRVVQSKLQV